MRRVLLLLCAPFLLRMFGGVAVLTVGLLRSAGVPRWVPACWALFLSLALLAAGADDLGLLDALRTTGPAASGELAVQFAVDGDLTGLPAAVEVAAYRIVGGTVVRSRLPLLGAVR